MEGREYYQKTSRDTSTSQRVAFLIAAVLLLGGCASPSATLLTVEAPSDRRATVDSQFVTTLTAPADQVLATPSTDPLERLLAAPDKSLIRQVEAPPLDPVVLEQAVHDRVNEVRRAHGLRPLGWSDQLVEVARAHSGDMAEHAYFGHRDRQGDDATARAERIGLDGTMQRGQHVVEGVGENLYLTHRFWEYRIYDAEDGKRTYVFEWKTLEELARQTVTAWLASKTHRANLLCPTYTTETIGVVIGENQTVFVTQNFVSRPST